MIDYLRNDEFEKDRIKFLNYLPAIGIDNVKDEIFAGLRARQKFISPKFFYDGKGSELFEEITHLKEYYPTRTEKSILSNFIKGLPIDFTDLNIVELGSGDHSKIALFLNQIPEDVLRTINYLPVDISRSAIERSSYELINMFELKSITGIVADFIHQLKLIPKKGKRLFCFFGSTIGNLTINEANKFITLLSGEMQAGDSLLLGMDMIKEIRVLEEAYNDKSGVTAKFNKNILSVVNNLTDTDFDQDDFEHYAFFNNEKRRIEMHLRARKELVVTFNSGSERVHVKKGETIHTENSHKFTNENIYSLGKTGNIKVRKIFSDKNNWFNLVHYIKES